jgi:GNAT superfamily N-acetyltransferase
MTEAITPTAPADPLWLDQLVRDLKGSLPGMVLLSLDMTVDGALAIGILRVPFDSRGAGHGPRILRTILAAADERGLDVVCTPTGEYGANRDVLVRALGRAGFAPSPHDPSGHTMRRPAGAREAAR